MKKILSVLVLFLVLLSTIPTIQTQTKQPAPLSASVPLGSTDYPWRMFHHDPLRTGASPASAPSIANPAWSYATNGAVYASPAVSDGLVFISSWDGAIYALNENTGALQWSLATGVSIYSSPAVANGIVYVGSRNGGMYAINEQTGGLIWVIGNSNCAITSSPAIADGKVFYGTWSQGGCVDPGQFVARYANNGTLVWTNPLIASASVRSSPAVDSGRVFFGQDNGQEVALNETTGQQIWTRTLGAATVVGSAPAISNGRLYLGTDNGFFELNEFTGARITPFFSPAANTTSAAVTGGAVYFGSGTGFVYKVNATTGAQIWRATIGIAVNSSPALALGTNTLLIGANDGYLYALNMTSGATVWRYQTSGPVTSSPAVADGRAFVGSQDSKLYTIGTAPPPSPTLHVGIFPSTTALKPGQVALLTITVTNGTDPESAVNLTLTSTAGGGFTLPVEKSPGLYLSNYTAPLTPASSAVTTTIRVVAVKPGFLNGSAQTSITLEPFPSLTISVTVDQTSVSPGGDVLLQIRVLNGTVAVTRATIILSSTGAGTFSPANDAGNGNYSSTFSTGLQDSGSNTMTVQAVKRGFSPAQTQVTIIVSGFVDLQKSKLLGLPIVILILGAAFVVPLLIIIGAYASRKKKTADASPRVPNYAFKTPVWFPGRLN